MLHTDAHNPSIERKKKMTLPQFLSQLRYAYIIQNQRVIAITIDTIFLSQGH